jgi:hypothetical protein
MGPPEIKVWERNEKRFCPMLLPALSAVGFSGIGFEMLRGYYLRSISQWPVLINIRRRLIN